MTVRFVPRAGGQPTPPPPPAYDSGLCERSLNFLAHAQCIELDIGSRCGGHGVCGGDRVRITGPARDQLSPVTEAEREHLSASELADGWRLACQVFPEKSGLAIDTEFDAP